MTQQMGKIMQNTTLLEFFPPPQNLKLSASATGAQIQVSDHSVLTGIEPTLLPSVNLSPTHPSTHRPKHPPFLSSTAARNHQLIVFFSQIGESYGVQSYGRMEPLNSPAQFLNLVFHNCYNIQVGHSQTLHTQKRKVLPKNNNLVLLHSIFRGERERERTPKLEAFFLFSNPKWSFMHLLINLNSLLLCNNNNNNNIIIITHAWYLELLSGCNNNTIHMYQELLSGLLQLCIFAADEREREREKTLDRSSIK